MSAAAEGKDDRAQQKGAARVVVVPAGVAHRFVNSGDGRLPQVDIHASDRFVTEWLEGGPQVPNFRRSAAGSTMENGRNEA